MLDKWENKDERPVFDFRDVTLTEVDEMIATLANSSSFGHDGLDSLSIKAAATNLRCPLQYIINSSLRTSNFPMKWKLARIIPRLKSPELDRNDVSSFRPISVLATVSKLVERAAQGQLLKFLESTQQLNPSCHAYRAKMSTTTTLTDVLDEIYQGIEENKLISMMTVDQSAAFDCLHRDLLLQKLSRYNIGQRALDWVDDYLKFRTQYVVVGASESRMVPVNRGVPQGSVIGPLLYAVYVNDITEVVKNGGCQEVVHDTPSRLFSKQCSKCGILSVYADDSTYTVSNNRRPGNQTSLNRVQDEMHLYLNDNQLSMNLGKTHLTEIMIQQKRGRTIGDPPHLTVELEPGVYKDIRDKTTTRILGANIQANGLWNSHLETGPRALFPQVRKLLGMLRHLGPKIPTRCRNNLSKGLIHSRLSYLMPLWGGASIALIKKAQVLLNIAARWTSGQPKKTKIKVLMKTVGWLDIGEQIKSTTAVNTWKVVNYHKPIRLRDRYTITPEKLIQIEEPRLQFTETCLRWRGAQQWNQLPTQLRTETLHWGLQKTNEKIHLGSQGTRPSSSLNLLSAPVLT